MSLIALRKYARLLIGSSLAIVLLAGGVAFAVGTIPGQDGVIHACFKSSTGDLRVIDPTRASCNPSESPIFWNQEGVPGQDGADGTNGTDGIDGTNGTNGLDGKTVLNGTERPDETIGTLGDFYLDTASSTLYGPLTERGWGEGTSLVGPAGVDGTDGADGADGTDGVDGTDGTDGVDGAPGPRGPSGFASAIAYSSSGPTAVPQSVLCPSGDIAIGGGGYSDDPAAAMLMSHPITFVSGPVAGLVPTPHGDSPDGWRVQFRGTSNVTGYVICATSS